MQMELTGLSGWAALVLEDDSGEQLRLPDETGTQDELIAIALDPGTYYLRVEAQRSGTTTYKLRYSAAFVAQSSVPAAWITAVSNPVSEGTAAAFQVTLGEAAAAELNVSVSVTESGSMLSGTPPASVAFAEGESTTLTVAISNGVAFGADQAVALALYRKPCTSSRCSQTPIRSISWGQCAARHPRSGHSPEWPWNSMPATRSLRHCR